LYHPNDTMTIINIIRLNIMKTKNNLFKLALSILFIGILFASCKKDDSNEDASNENGIYLKSINQGNTQVVGFAYDANNKLTEQTRNFGGNQVLITYTYANGKITGEIAKQNNSTIWQYIYGYNNNGNLTRCDIGGATNTYWTFHYTNGKIDKAIEVISGEDAKKQTFTYNGDNIIEAKEFSRFGNTWELQKRYTFECDTKNNPYKLFKIPYNENLNELALLLNENNITVEKKYDGSGVLLETIQYNYIYNAKNYPKTVQMGSDSFSYLYKN